MAYKKCKWLDIGDDARFTKNDAARCTWPLPDMVFPVSITRRNNLQILHRAYVSKDDCAKCPCFELRGKDTTT